MSYQVAQDRDQPFVTARCAEEAAVAQKVLATVRGKTEIRKRVHASDSTTPEQQEDRPLAAALWVLQDGSVDKGVAYPLAEWESILTKRRVEILGLVGSTSAGAVLTWELWASEGEGRRRSLSAGIGFALPFDALNVEGGSLVLVGVVRP